MIAGKKCFCTPLLITFLFYTFSVFFFSGLSFSLIVSVTDRSSKGQKMRGALQSRRMKAGWTWLGGWGGQTSQGYEKEDKELVLKHDDLSAHPFSWFTVSVVIFPISSDFLARRLQLLPALHLNSESVSTTLTCCFVKNRYVQVLFPFHFGTVSQRKTRFHFSRQQVSHFTTYFEPLFLFFSDCVSVWLWFYVLKDLLP